MSKTPCGACDLGVKYSAIVCTGPCRKWFHSKCTGMSTSDFRKIIKAGYKSWSCKECKLQRDSIPFLPTCTTPLIDQKIETTSECQVKTSSEDLQAKIKQFQAQEQEDLETSLTLAAEVGNVLLTENNKLKQDLHDLTIENTKLTHQIFNKNNSLEMSYEAKIEELEHEKESLLNQITSITETLNEAEQQLIKERQLRAELTTMFEDQDKDKDQVICNLEKEIKNLQQTIKNPTKYNVSGNHQAKNTLTFKNSESQTHSSELPTQNSSLSLLLELAKLKTWQEETENTLTAIKSKIFQQENGKNTNFPSNTQPTPSCESPKTDANGRIRKQLRVMNRNIFSVSLQMKKSKEKDININNTKSKLNTLQSSLKSTPCPKSTQCAQQESPIIDKLPANRQTFKVQKGPPCTAKKLQPNESLEDFLNQHMEYINGISHHKLPQCKQHNQSILKDSNQTLNHFLGVKKQTDDKT